MFLRVPRSKEIRLYLLFTMLSLVHRGRYNITVLIIALCKSLETRGQPTLLDCLVITVARPRQLKIISSDSQAIILSS